MGTSGAAQTRLTTISQFDGHPDWQALVSGYPRPKGATPSRASLGTGVRAMQCSDTRARPAARLPLVHASPAVGASHHRHAGRERLRGELDRFVAPRCPGRRPRPAGGLRRPDHVLPHRRALPHCDQHVCGRRPVGLHGRASLEYLAVPQNLKGKLRGVRDSARLTFESRVWTKNRLASFQRSEPQKNQQ